MCNKGFWSCTCHILYNIHPLHFSPITAGHRVLIWQGNGCNFLARAQRKPVNEEHSHDISRNTFICHIIFNCRSYIDVMNSLKRCKASNDVIILYKGVWRTCFSQDNYLEYFILKAFNMCTQIF